MADELELRLDRSDSFGSPGYEDFELSSVLTEAESLYVKKFISQLNNRKSEGFEETEIRNQGLSALIKRGAQLTVSSNQTDVFSNGGLNGKFFDLPDDFMYCIYEEAKIDQAPCGAPKELIVANVKVLGHDEVNRLFRNKYKKPFFKSWGEALVWRLTFSREFDGHDPSVPASSKRHQLISHESFAVVEYSINYLKNSPGIIVDRDITTNQRNCILDESTHSVIVDMAVALMMGRVKEQRVVNSETLKDLE